MNDHEPLTPDCVVPNICLPKDINHKTGGINKNNNNEAEKNDIYVTIGM